MKSITLKENHRHKLPMGILSMALLPDGVGLVAGCMDGVYLTSIDKSREPKLLYSHGNYVSSVVSLGGDTIVSAGYDGTARWFDLAEQKVTDSVKLHDFWSWDMTASPDGKHLASVTGQYLAGGYKYEPQEESEPSIRVVDVASKQIVHSLPHVPSVQSVAISPDNQFVAAGNLMGEVRIYRIADGELVSQWTTSDFTSWGIIKSHCYLGGIFAMQFSRDGKHLLLAGMGPMRDPMAGNGKQLWQKWDWQAAEPKMIDQTHEGDAGEGLMETLAVHPSGEMFAMGGRLRGGDWNVALFDMQTGDRMAILKLGFRATEATFTPDGKHLVIVGTQGQPSKPKPKGDGFPDFGRVEVFAIESEAT
ncbi:WD40 repeat domain-containing protein [Rosistilla oblonga]|uniref:WD40 repeat domain-containing protein n=1 Tax=Rosistilla oblonga TaxID=2527990 RepID=UPI003A986BF5